jgi:hypothetical protein
MVLKLFSSEQNSVGGTPTAAAGAVALPIPRFAKKRGQIIISHG